jgi:hypothetical protein
MTLRAFPVAYASDVEAVAAFWELLGFRRHVQVRRRASLDTSGSAEMARASSRSPTRRGPSIGRPTDRGERQGPARR